MFFALLSGGGLCGSTAVWQSKNRSEALCFVRSPRANAFFARDEPSSKRVGGVGLSRKPPRLRSWRCTQPRAAKATAGVPVVGNMTSIPRAAAIVRYTLLEGGARNAPR